MKLVTSDTKRNHTDNMALASKLTTDLRCDSQDDDDEDQEEDFPYYYEHDYDQDIPDSNDVKKDPEYFEFETLSIEDVERYVWFLWCSFK